MSPPQGDADGADGQHPRKYADTYIMLEQVGHRLDREVERLYVQCEAEGLKGRCNRWWRSMPAKVLPHHLRERECG